MMPVSLHLLKIERITAICRSMEYSLIRFDRFFIFSDGYHDLYDRANDKKFTTKRYKELLLSTSSLKMSEQEQVLEKTYIDWCGDYKQIDDIIIIGVEI